MIPPVSFSNYIQINKENLTLYIHTDQKASYQEIYAFQCQLEIAQLGSIILTYVTQVFFQSFEYIIVAKAIGECVSSERLKIVISDPLP